jgi:carbonic anhydrase
MATAAQSATDTLLERNAARSRSLGEKSFTLTPDLHAIVLTCADHRVDPAHVLGLELGEAVVLRNPGGRITPAVIGELAVLATVAQIEGLETGFELIIMHHTDCGLTRLDGPEQRGLMAYFFGVAEDELAAKHLRDPSESVRTDLELLRANPLIPRTLIASALVYDIASGRVEMICAPESLGGAAQTSGGQRLAVDAERHGQE